VIGPIIDALDAAREPYRVLLLPDHATPCAIKTHTADPVPYLLFDSERDGAGGTYDEPGVLHTTPVPAHSLMGRLTAV
jgi:2,3-bisphosphoglycerate-independent phosphoglycerate mutase